MAKDSTRQLSLLAGVASADAGSGEKDLAPGSAADQEKNSEVASSVPVPAAARVSNGRSTVYLVDGPNIAFRAHYAIRNLTNSNLSNGAKHFCKLKASY